MITEIISLCIASYLVNGCSIAKYKEMTLKNKQGEGIFAEMITNKGNILLQLEYQKTPKTVGNFICLTEKGFYKDVIFHRVIKDFMIQGGDPTGTGHGGPGYQFSDEFHPELKHIGPGILSMANVGPNTNGSQFFITVTETPWLDNRHTVFGKVTEGMDIVKKIAEVETGNDKKPIQKIYIKKMTIIRNGEDAKNFIACKEML